VETGVGAIDVGVEEGGKDVGGNVLVEMKVGWLVAAGAVVAVPVGKMTCVGVIAGSGVDVFVGLNRVAVGIAFVY